MLADGYCKHGIPLDEGCVLCFDQEAVEPTERKTTIVTTFDADVARFVKFITQRRDWMTASVILTAMRVYAGDTGRFDHDQRRFSRTYLRHLAKGSRGRVMSGQRGYKATKHATHQEVNEVAAGLLKAAQGCCDRRGDILFVYHHGRARTDKERTADDRVQETEKEKTKNREGDTTERRDLCEGVLHGEGADVEQGGRDRAEALPESVGGD